MIQAPPVPIFVGLDLSLTSTGVAVIHGDRVTVARVKSTPVPNGTSEDQASRMSVIARTILDGIPVTEHTHVGVEGPSFGSKGTAAHILGGLWWIVRDVLRCAGLPVTVVPPTVVKKYATGAGNAGKDEVLAAVVRRYPHVDVRGNDEADALVIAAILARLTGFPIDDMPQSHLAALNGVGR